MKNIKFLYRAFRYRYQLDTQEIRFIIQHLRKGDICVDIGCHKGGYLYWMRKSVGKLGKVYAFEPQPKLFAYLQEITSLRNYQNVVVENMGLSSRAGTAKLLIPNTSKGTSPGARIDHSGNPVDLQTVEVALTTLDDYFFARQIRPSLLKIDVEGHEKEVLLGGLELLKSCRPKLVMECESRHLQEGDIFGVFEVLLNLDYEGYFFEDRKMQPLSAFKLERHQRDTGGEFWQNKDYVNNFVFI